MDAEQKITSLKIDGFQGVLKNSVCNGKFVIENDSLRERGKRMNSKLKIAIIDDNVQTVQLISNAVKMVFLNLSVEVELTCFYKPEVFLSSLNEKEFNLLFLDIEMPKVDGVEIAKTIREKRISTDIIFISNREDRVFDTFAVAPFGFIRKSRFLDDINSVISLYVKKKLNPEIEQSFVLSTNKETISLPIKDIVYIENKDHVQYFYIKGKEEPYTLRSTLKTIAYELTEHGFLEPCKGFLVNYRYVSSIRADNVILLDQKVLPLARRKTSSFKEEYMIWKKRDMSVIL